MHGMWNYIYTRLKQLVNVDASNVNDTSNSTALFSSKIYQYQSYEINKNTKFDKIVCINCSEYDYSTIIYIYNLVEIINCALYIVYAGQIMLTNSR